MCRLSVLLIVLSVVGVATGMRPAAADTLIEVSIDGMELITSDHKRVHSQPGTATFVVFDALRFGGVNETARTILNSFVQSSLRRVIHEKTLADTVNQIEAVAQEVRKGIDENARLRGVTVREVRIGFRYEWTMWRGSVTSGRRVTASGACRQG